MDQEQEIAALKKSVTRLEHALRQQLDLVKVLADEVPLLRQRVGCLNHIAGSLIAELARFANDPLGRADEIICFHEASLFEAIKNTQPGQPALELVQRNREEQLAEVFGYARSTAKLIDAMR